jgi:hypothetical protein
MPSLKVLSVLKKRLVTQAAIFCVCYLLFNAAVSYSEYIDSMLGFLVNMTVILLERNSETRSPTIVAMEKQ